MDHSFLLASPFEIPQYTKFDPPAACDGGPDSLSEANGINDNAVISGNYSDCGREADSGYVRSTNGFYSTINFPTDFTGTHLGGINNKGAFVGTFSPGNCCPSETPFDQAFIAK
jgi:hypothetical protein